MKIYSEITKEFYPSVEECTKAEAAIAEEKKKAEQEKKRLTAERKARAQEVEDARKAMEKSQQEYKKILGDFLRDYGTYHYSTTSLEDLPKLLDWSWIFDF